MRRQGGVACAGRGSERTTMKYALAIIIVAILVGGAAYTYVRIGEQKNQERELAVRKAEAAQKKAEAEQKRAEAEKRKAEADQRRAASEAAAAKSKETAAQHARQERQAAAAEAKSNAEMKAAEAKRVEAARETARADARKAEEERKAAEARTAEAVARAEYAAATNAAKQAELQTALVVAQAAELDLQKTLAASNMLALQKADYAAKIEEIKQLQEVLRQREEETRPNKTLLQLMAQNEAAREAELAEMAKQDAAYAEEEAIRRKILRDGVPAAPKKPLTRAERHLAAVNEDVQKASDERRTAEEKLIVTRLEGLVQQALKDGRAEDAEAYLVALKSLVPGYDGKKLSAGVKAP